MITEKSNNNCDINELRICDIKNKLYTLKAISKL